jgi:hypothetical protein
MVIPNGEWTVLRLYSSIFLETLRTNVTVDGTSVVGFMDTIIILPFPMICFIYTLVSYFFVYFTTMPFSVIYRA